jgi:endonuclease/exonuclease/phosphatase family metal-dependent hydrolase
MRIVSYNILDGGEGRADPLAEVIEAQRPDVVALVEATDLSVIERIARRLRFDYVQAIGRDQASALLTRYTIRQSVNHALLDERLTKSLLEADIVDASGNQWGIGVVHLHHHHTEEDESIRERELQALLEVFEPHRREQRPHIICGDFNADSPIAQIDPQKCKQGTREAFASNGGKLPRRAIQAMLVAGYVDTLHGARGDHAATAGTFTTQTPGQRVDYIFTHGVERQRIQEAWIEYDRLAKYASDHFPVGASII